MRETRRTGAASLLREHGWASAHDEFFPYDGATAHAAAVSGELQADSDYESADDHSAKRAKTAAAGATEVEKLRTTCIHTYLMYLSLYLIMYRTYSITD